MRRWFPSVSATLALLLAGCGTEMVFPVSGVAEVEPAVLDFGRVALGSTATRELKVHNRGRAPLQLKEIAIEGLGEDIEIVNRGTEQLGAGQSTVLAVRFSPQEEAILERQLGLELTDEERPEVAVPVTGIGVRPRVSLEPASLDFGRIELNVPEDRTVTLRNEFDMPVDVRLGRRGDVQYSYGSGDVVTVPPLGSLDVPVTFLPERTGRADAQVAVMPCPTCVEQVVPMTGVGIDQALVVNPPVIDFGFVPVDRGATRQFTVTNAGSKVLEVRSMQLASEAAGRGSDFRIEPKTAQLAEGEQIAVTIHFTPGSKGERTDTLHIESSSERMPTSAVAVRGVGGGPEIKVTVRDGTDCIDFGRVPFGSRPYRYITISNIGADPGAPDLQVTNIFPVPGASPLFGTDVELPINIPTGQAVDVAIWYEPNELSIGNVDEGMIAVTSNDGSQPEIRVCTSGTAGEPPPCDGLEITPGVVDFGSMDERRGAALSVKIRNVGSDACIIRDLNVAEGSDPVFWTTPIPSHTILGGTWFGWDVYFDPARANAGLGDWTGELEVFAINQGNTRYAVPLVAKSADGCLVPEPRFIDFGDDPAGCGTRSDAVTFTNVCSVPVTVTDISLGEPTSEDEFQITDAPATPFVVAPTEGFPVAVEWLSQNRGLNSVPLYVSEDSRDGPLMVPLRGELTEEGRVQDEFVQHAPNKTDILLVVDNSATMREEQGRLLTSVGTLVDEAAFRGIDYRIAVTTTGIRPPSDPTLPACPGGANGAEAGRFFPVDGSRPRIITGATPNGRQVLAENTQVGLCHQQEEGMQAMRLALTEPLRSGSNAGFLRDDANLSVIFISEEDDHSGFPVNEYVTFLNGLKGVGGARANAIVDVNNLCSQTSGVAHRYLQLVGATGGIPSSICAPNFAGTFSGIATQAFAPRDGFTLSQTPDGTGLEVLVNGVVSPQSAWTYDAGSNTIRFANPPAAGSRIRVNYTATCR
ncbi:choice-of-anchor D domain-containing protein [Vulgatibacter sp.]|uniref:choice-of-anchor D domain-containing protein n=1 Tax=Vulgatibacter sp. TaxID=1971226 RepID=UPI003561575F